MKSQFIKYLESFVNENRIKLLDTNLENRTRYLTIVLEDIYQTHNASAVLRTCDCFGIQDVYIIENKNKYSPNDQIALGAEQWLCLNRYNETENNTRKALQSLKDKGYRIIATTLKKQSTALDEFNIVSAKSALVFGTELTGISKEVEDMADEFLHIPMYGFTESLNISVAAAVVIQYLTLKLRSSNTRWQLSEEEKLDLKINWLKNSIKKVDLIEKHFYEVVCKNLQIGL